jgi:hypothetical protein
MNFMEFTGDIAIVPGSEWETSGITFSEWGDKQ